MSLPAPARLRGLIDALAEGLIDRETAARLLLLAALAGEHVLLTGPPGTAKSALARRLHAAMADGRHFERLLTRFSTPEELFGPLSLAALEQDRYERLTDGFLPTAGIAFLDEVFKANSAILNALLTLLNERTFDNGSGRVRTPLVCVVGASNEGPADESLRAFHDRFLLRVPVEPVADARFAELLRLPTHEPQGPLPGALDAAARAAVTAAAARVTLGEDAIAGCSALRAWLAAQGRALSDRRWRQWVGLMRVAAATEGRDAVDALDLWLAPYVAADTPEQVAPLAMWFEADWLQAVPQDAPWLSRAVEAFEQQLGLEERAEDDDDSAPEAGKMALARSVGGAGDPGDEGFSAHSMRLLTTALARQRRRHWSPVHVAARLAQVDEVIAHATVARDAVATQADTLNARLAQRLWWPPALAARTAQAHAHTRAVLDGLLARLLACRAGYAALPVDEALPAVAPQPLDWAPA